MQIGLEDHFRIARQFMKIKLITVSNASIISSQQFAFIKGYISIDTIYYLLCNQCEVHLSDEGTDEENGVQFIWPYFYWIILRCKDTNNHYSSEFILNFFLWNGVNRNLMRLY